WPVAGVGVIPPASRNFRLPMRTGRNGRRHFLVFGRVGAVGIEMVASTMVGFYAGGWVDTKLRTGWLKWAGLVVGIAAGFRSFYRMALRVRKELDSDER